MADGVEPVDYATVRDTLLEASKRRGHLSYEQKMALQHAEWAASDDRVGFKTEAKVFAALFNDLIEIEKLAKAPAIAAKIAEMMPVHAEELRAILASKRIAMDTGEIEAVIDIVRKQVA
uniref:DNA-directed RNA polymerase subunit F n=1 Tax=uncultured marine group II/III euryarchaeote KM3_155_E06 TaxID=1457897 RepID=A0A075GG70_9EURY|nr:hypothetical protein [uncultured marine group II/III euryarchaeote KM3_155_E06]